MTQIKVKKIGYHTRTAEKVLASLGVKSPQTPSEIAQNEGIDYYAVKGVIEFLDGLGVITVVTNGRTMLVSSKEAIL